MGLINAILGNASETDSQKVLQSIGEILTEGEQIAISFVLYRDLIVFTTKRLVLVDKQGISGKKVEWLCVPYKSIVRFSAESAGTFDLDSTLRIWTLGDPTPLQVEFRKDINIREVMKVLGQYVL